MAYNAALGYDPDKDYTVDALKQQLTSLATQLQEKAGATGSYTYKDFTNTQEYGDLKNRYEYSGQRAAKDTLGQVAARTGGMASSYAQSAAQQGYNDWMARLYDAAQQSYTNEYNRWSTERGEAQDRITAYLQAGGSYGSLDGDLVKKSGYTTSELSALQSYYARLLAQQFAPAEREVVYVNSGADDTPAAYGTNLNRGYTTNVNTNTPLANPTSADGNYVKVGNSWVTTAQAISGAENGTYKTTTGTNGKPLIETKKSSEYDPTRQYSNDYNNYMKKNGAR